MSLPATTPGPLPPARPDLFGPFHKGLRALLFAAAGATARADLSDDHATGALILSTQRLIGFLREHSLIEDMYVLPVVAAHDAALARALARGHAELEELQAQLGAALARADTAAPADRPGHGPGLTSLINRLVAGHLVHMEQEERQASPALWAGASDDELAGIRRRIAQSMTTERSLEWMQVVLPAVNPIERAILTTSFTRTAATATDGPACPV